MPIYEYVCRQCGHELEVLQKMSDPALADCPACGKAELVKKISAAGFRLSGSGWYETDFKKGSNKKNLRGGEDASAKPKSDDSGSGAKSDAASTAKPASKPAASSD